MTSTATRDYFVNCSGTQRALLGTAAAVFWPRENPFLCFLLPPPFEAQFPQHREAFVRMTPSTISAARPGEGRSRCSLATTDAPGGR